MNDFKRMHDNGPVCLLEHVRGIVDQEPGVEVVVGCDSHNFKRHTLYTTTVVLRFKRNGAQVIYRREKAKKVTDLWTRLWGEVERSLAVAHALRDEGGIRVSRIDMDLNSDPQHGSHRLHATAVGYIRSHGYEPRTKPDLLIASWAANVLCQ
jgi:predicted RNase H-related nuclease YkuK (DUF458 family)